DEGRLDELEGFGKAIATKISELVQTGKLPYYDALVAEFPVTLLEVVQIPGVGPKKAATLHRELGVVDLASLEKACHAQRVRALKGFGEKSELSILEGLASLAKRSG